MLPGLFLRDRNDGHVQAAADSGSDVFEPDTLFGDGVVPGPRCAFLQGKPVESGHVGDMPVPDERVSLTRCQLTIVNVHHASSIGSERVFGTHFLTCSNVPSFLS